MPLRRNSILSTPVDADAPTMAVATTAATAQARKVIRKAVAAATAVVAIDLCDASKDRNTGRNIAR